MGRRLVLIADDLTGACDAGVQFARPDSPCTVLVDGTANLTPLLEGLGRIVVDTESRHLGSAKAGAAAGAVAREVRAAAHDCVIYKKIDSTLRGQIAAEVEALAGVFSERVIVMAPAYPAAGRTTERGRCLVRGVPVDETEFAHDLRTPVRSARIADHIRVPGTIVEARIRDLPAILRSAAGGDAIVLDAQTQADLEALAALLMDEPERYLFVGTAGLAAALAAGHTSADEPGARTVTSPGRPPVPLECIVGIVGSRSERSRAQLEALRETLDPLTVTLGDDEVLSEAAAWRFTIVNACAAASRSGRDLVVVPAVGDGGRDPVRIAEFLGKAGSVAVGESRVGLFLTGGDTALAVLRALGAAALRVYAEIAPGIPAVGIVVGDPTRTGSTEIPAVTKAGGFGDDEAMVRAFACLKEGVCWR